MRALGSERFGSQVHTYIAVHAASSAKLDFQDPDEESTRMPYFTQNAGSRRATQGQSYLVSSGFPENTIPRTHAAGTYDPTAVFRSEGHPRGYLCERCVPSKEPRLLAFRHERITRVLSHHGRWRAKMRHHASCGDVALVVGSATEEGVPFITFQRTPRVNLSTHARHLLHRHFSFSAVPSRHVGGEARHTPRRMNKTPCSLTWPITCRFHGGFKREKSHVHES